VYPPVVTVVVVQQVPVVVFAPPLVQVPVVDLVVTVALADVVVQHVPVVVFAPPLVQPLVGLLETVEPLVVVQHVPVLVFAPPLVQAASTCETAPKEIATAKAATIKI
jgi:hypothetical protein